MSRSTLLPLLIAVWASGAWAVTSVIPSPSPVPTSTPSAESLSALQAVELKPIQGREVPESLLVGDTLTLDAAGLAQLGKDTKLTPVDEKKGFYEQGWLVKSDGDAIKFTPRSPGLTSTPEIIVRASDGRGLLRLLPFSIKVDSAIAKDDPNAAEPDPAFPPQSAPFPWFWAVLLGLLGLLLLSGIVYLLLKFLRGRTSRPMQPLPATPPLPEDLQALELLAKLEALGLPEKREFKRLYFAASEILKTYLGRRYSFDAPESTSAELVQRLRSISEFPSARVQQIEDLLARMDLVKFTDEIPQVNAARQILSEIREIVNSTRRPPPPVDGGKP